jgi:hypothetical protein
VRHLAADIFLIGLLTGCAPPIQCPPHEVARKDLLCPACIPTNPCPCHEGWVCREDPRVAERRREQQSRQAQAARLEEQAAKRQAEEAERQQRVEERRLAEERAGEQRRAEERAAEERARRLRDDSASRPREAPAQVASPARRAKCNAGAGRCCLEDGTIVRPCGPIGRPDCNQYTSLCGSGGFCRGCRCLPPDARVLTPTGQIEISKLRHGDAVTTLSADGQRVRATVLRVARQQIVTAHQMVVLRLEGGRTTRGSAAHPLADGRTLGQLRVGDRVDASTVVSVSRAPFAGDATWDVLPSGETGAYLIDGIPLKSTLTAMDAPRPPAAACQRDADCVLASRTAGACPESMPRTAAEALRREQEKLCAGGRGPREICGPMPGCIHGMAGKAACEQGRCVVRAPPPPEGVVECRRRRSVQQIACRGAAAMPGDPSTVTSLTCDGCASNDDCTLRPKGRCVLVGGQPCDVPAAYVCRYQGDTCDGCPYCTNDGHGKAVCRRTPLPLPPSAPR